MSCSKPAFFIVLCSTLVMPFILYNILWILQTKTSTGTMRYVGKSYSGQLPKQYAVIRFFIGKDTVWFEGMDNYLFKIGEKVPIRYCEKNPSNARINSFIALWGDTIMYITPLVLILTICFFHPDLVPAGSRISLFARKPFIQII